MPEKNKYLLHNTCTSTSLSNEKGAQPEWIPQEILDQLHFEQTGTPISSNPVVAIIQRERAIVRHKRNIGKSD